MTQTKKKSKGKNIILHYITPVWKRAIFNTVSLLKLMIPIIILIKIFQELNLTGYLVAPLAPIMEFVGVPSVYALAWLGGILNNNYTSFSIIIMLFQSNPITYAQLTVLCLMTCFCHSVIVEALIARKLGVSTLYIVTLRFFCAISSGFLVNAFFLQFNLLQDIVNNPIILQSPAETNTLLDYINAGSFFANIFTWIGSLYLWFLEQVKTIVLIFTIIFTVFLLVKVLEDLKLLSKLGSLFSPICKVLKISKDNSIITLITFIVGLSYSYGLLKETYENKPSFRNEQSFCAVTFLALIHAVIEEPLTFIILGASFWILIVFRFFYSILITYIIHKFILPKLSNNFKHKYLYKPY